MTGVQELRQHQRVGVEALLREWEMPAGADVSECRRAQIRWSCGAGKTRLAAEAARRVGGTGLVLVAEPTLGLLKQNLQAFVEDGGVGGPIAAVCSLSSGDPVLARYGARVTTRPVPLAFWWHQMQLRGHRSGLVFATYASVPRIAQAHALRLSRVPALPPWELVVADEAHHLAGSERWSMVLDQEQIPARRLLTMTATPRVYSMRPYGAGSVTELGGALSDPVQEEEPEPGTAEVVGGDEGEVAPGEPLASMDNPALFGRKVHEVSLLEAQDLDLVAGLRIVVAQVDDPEYRAAVALEGRTSARARGLYLAAQQTAVLQAAQEHGLKRVLTYHHFVPEARAFARSLAAQAARLRAAGAMVPERVWARALTQDSSLAERDDALWVRLTKAIDDVGAPVDLAVVPSVRLLGEGMDVPEVEAIALVDARSPIPSIQAVGRCLRIPAKERRLAAAEGRRPEKVATIIVPIVYEAAGDRASMLGPAWDPLVKLLRALRSHSDELVQKLAAGGRESDAALTAVRASGDDGATRPQAKRDLVQFMLGGHEAEDLARLVRLRVEASHFYDVALALEAAERYREREGHLAVPRRHRERGVELGVQLDTWRSARRSGALDEDVLGRLEALGVEWEPRRSAQEVNWAGLAAYASARRHLLPRRAETFEVDGQEVAVGRLMTEARRPGARLGAELDGLGVPWRVQGPWDAAWQRHLVLVDLYLADGGSVADLMAGSRTYGGEDLGAWLGEQLRRGAKLGEQQVRALAERGVVLAVESSGAAAERRPRGARAQAVVEAARQYVGEVGPLVDARGRHAVRADWTATVDGMEVRLLMRLNKARERRAGLDEGMLAAYAGWGLGWAVDELAQRGEATG
ncbi:Helicase associated domain protein [Streptomyces sp. NPDC056891]|uniref:Helicase associated domain protein n=1 Tax=Streptomyces sp. NPDC056891 TaxID=3345961 RepID=UPI0036CABF02